MQAKASQFDVVIRSAKFARASCVKSQFVKTGVVLLSLPLSLVDTVRDACLTR